MQTFKSSPSLRIISERSKPSRNLFSKIGKLGLVALTTFSLSCGGHTSQIFKPKNYEIIAPTGEDMSVHSVSVLELSKAIKETKKNKYYVRFYEVAPGFDPYKPNCGLNLTPKQILEFSLCAGFGGEDPLTKYLECCDRFEYIGTDILNLPYINFKVKIKEEPSLVSNDSSIIVRVVASDEKIIKKPVLVFNLDPLKNEYGYYNSIKEKGNNEYKPTFFGLAAILKHDSTGLRYRVFILPDGQYEIGSPVVMFTVGTSGVIEKPQIYFVSD